MFRKGIQRLTQNGIILYHGQRTFSVMGRVQGVQPFLMPAMSPTMEKGGVVSWKFAPGQQFQAGDVLLEVETDKAQIDVEAQDDGQMMKIVVPEGSKDIDVGTTIAYLADVDDDIIKLEIPQESIKPKKKQGETETSSPEEKIEIKGPIEEKPLNTVKHSVALPSVNMLLAQNGISLAEIQEKIKGSGYQGRIIKGDVLAYLQKIPQDSVNKISEYVKNSGKLDLSNIEIKKMEGTDSKEESVKEEPVKKQEKKVVPPQTIQEDIILSIPHDSTTAKELRQSIDNFIKETYQFVHNGGSSPEINSQYYDPLFEDLITVSPREPRFTYGYKLVPLSMKNEGTSPEIRDIFDILNGTEVRKPDLKQTCLKDDEWLLSIDVTVNNKFSDSTEKAERFISYTRELSSVE